jgi:bla regulator protein BlaR1
MCQIRRRDNLATEVDTVVEAVFWFHPLGARVVEERKRACDEEVLEAGGDAQTYAESILKVCGFHLVSPLDCVGGVGGANLTKRIEEIMNHQIAQKLNFSEKLFLAGAALLAVAGPVLVGVIDAPSVRAQSQPAAPSNTRPNSMSSPSSPPSPLAEERSRSAEAAILARSRSWG